MRGCDTGTGMAMEVAMAMAMAMGDAKSWQVPFVTARLDKRKVGDMQLPNK